MWLAVSSKGGVTPIVKLHIVKTGRIALFLAAGFARVAIKELLLSGVPIVPLRLSEYCTFYFTL